MKPRVDTERENVEADFLRLSQTSKNQQQEDTVLEEVEASRSEDSTTQEEEAILEENPQIPLAPITKEGDVEQRYQRPVRERRTPRVFTCDQLGQLVCQPWDLRTTLCIGLSWCHMDLRKLGMTPLHSVYCQPGLISDY